MTHTCRNGHVWRSLQKREVVSRVLYPDCKVLGCRQACRIAQKPVRVLYVVGVSRTACLSSDPTAYAACFVRAHEICLLRVDGTYDENDHPTELVILSLNRISPDFGVRVTRTSPSRSTRSPTLSLEVREHMNVVSKCVDALFETRL